MRRQLDYWIGVPLLRAARWWPGRKSDGAAAPRNLLVIKLAAFGDAIVLIPTLRALRRALPDTQIHWLVSRINEDIARLVPYVDRVIVLPSLDALSFLSMCHRLRKENYDAVIDCEQWSRGSALLALATGAPVRAGFSVPGQNRESAFTRTLRKNFTHHERDDFYQLASLVQPLNDALDLELWESSSGPDEVRQVIPDFYEPTSIKRVLLHPGCGADGRPREWPLDSYSRFAAMVSKSVPVQFYITGGPDDFEKASALASQIPFSVNLAGKLSWKGVISLVKEADMLVSGNTGIMHVAAAWQKPQIALHGPTDSKIWGPINDRAIVLRTTCPRCPCLKLGFEYHELNGDCMDKIAVERVLASALQLLAKE